MNCLKIPKKKSEIFRLNRVGQIYSWQKPECPEKTTDLSQAASKLYPIMLYRVHLENTKRCNTINYSLRSKYQHMKASRLGTQGDLT
jgi:hypothetical protein